MTKWGNGGAVPFDYASGWRSFLFFTVALLLSSVFLHLKFQATSDETYTSDELLEDLSECSAKHVYIVADQSFSGRLADALQSSEHINTRVTVFSSGSRHDYSWESELTNEWAHANHTDHCVASVYEVSVIDTITEYFIHS